ncbi:hypothetical protein BU26DRAFT_241230 [Trematosphaeria pertusa]|uniref:Uncharacterized protein n=1 Tax=Trematosphaeria pertusa TaxID=390896 RepID=A0A6A6IPZ5_9PLEO|nr:uncharacterized protein BU26DRAFT_241230 [Trematosphaeria pertusa]KAF2251660.1 hypothetical protein BU26DRAFT_241230 [Trematosphaeria pertusa]
MMSCVAMARTLEAERASCLRRAKDQHNKGREGDSRTPRPRPRATTSSPKIATRRHASRTRLRVQRALTSPLQPPLLPHTKRCTAPGTASNRARGKTLAPVLRNASCHTQPILGALLGCRFRRLSRVALNGALTTPETAEGLCW